ncbi:MAG: twin-arginine translocase TatA/TatE family subunit [Deltaproteobacteria bacterium]|nr:twin-arginine translocase TatA/TatE family subunit [Deltaproteobacteria bacterium]
MFGIGIAELAVIVIIALIFIDPEKLPEIAKALGRVLGEFRSASEDVRRVVSDAASPSVPPASVKPEALSAPALPPDKPGSTEGSGKSGGHG